MNREGGGKGGWNGAREGTGVVVFTMASCLLRRARGVGAGILKTIGWPVSLSVVIKGIADKDSI